MQPTSNRQSMADLAINAAGTLEALWQIAAANNASVSDQAQMGTDYLLPDGMTTDPTSLNYYAANGVVAATISPVPTGGIGYMSVGDDFYISKDA